MKLLLSLIVCASLCGMHSTLPVYPNGTDTTQQPQHDSPQTGGSSWNHWCRLDTLNQALSTVDANSLLTVDFYRAVEHQVSTIITNINSIINSYVDTLLAGNLPDLSINCPSNCTDGCSVLCQSCRMLACLNMSSDYDVMLAQTYFFITKLQPQVMNIQNIMKPLSGDISRRIGTDVFTGNYDLLCTVIQVMSLRHDATKVHPVLLVDINAIDATVRGIEKGNEGDFYPFMVVMKTVSRVLAPLKQQSQDIVAKIVELQAAERALLSPGSRHD